MGNSSSASLSEPSKSERSSADKTKSGTLIPRDSSKKSGPGRRKSLSKLKISNDSCKTTSSSSSNTNQEFCGKLKFDHIAIKQSTKPQPSNLNHDKIVYKESNFFDCNQTLPHVKAIPESKTYPRNIPDHDPDTQRHPSILKVSGMLGGAKGPEKRRILPIPIPKDVEVHKPTTTAGVEKSELTLSSQCSSSVFPHASLILEEARDAELRYIVPNPADTELEKNAGSPLKKTASEAPLKTQQPGAETGDDTSFNSCRVTYLYSHNVVGGKSKNTKKASENSQHDYSDSEKRLFKDPPSFHVHLSKPANVKSCVEGKVAEKHIEPKKLQKTYKKLSK